MHTQQVEQEKANLENKEQEKQKLLQEKLKQEKDAQIREQQHLAAQQKLQHKIDRVLQEEQPNQQLIESYIHKDIKPNKNESKPIVDNRSDLDDEVQIEDEDQEFDQGYNQDHEQDHEQDNEDDLLNEDMPNPDLIAQHLNHIDEDHDKSDLVNIKHLSDSKDSYKKSPVRSIKPRTEESDINDRESIEKDIDEEVNGEQEDEGDNQLPAEEPQQVKDQVDTVEQPQIHEQHPLDDDELAMLREDQPNEELINKYLQQDSLAPNDYERSYNFRSKEDTVPNEFSQTFSVQRNQQKPEELKKSFNEPFAEESKFGFLF